MESNQETKIKFISEDGDEVFFTVMEETTLNGVHYLLVMDDFDDEDSEALIMKEVSDKTAPEAVYDIVDDEQEITLIAAIFEELMDDVELVRP